MFNDMIVAMTGDLTLLILLLRNNSAQGLIYSCRLVMAQENTQGDDIVRSKTVAKVTSFIGAATEQRLMHSKLK